MSFNKNTGMYEGYIYLITNKINGKGYIGQTSKDIIKRWKQHLSHSKYEDTHLYNAMRKYGIDNFSICELDKVKCNTTQELNDLLNKLEIKYISSYDTYKNGYNLTIGGGNSSKKCKAPVDVYSLDGVLLNSFDSSIEASAFYDIRSSTISSICYGKRIQTRGLIFREKGSPFNLHPTKKQIKTKTIYQFDIKTGRLIETHNTHEKLTNILSIQSAIRNKHAAFGYYWSYEDNINIDNMKKRNKISVSQYDRSGNLLNCFESLLEASYYMCGKRIRNKEQQTCYVGISNVINGVNKSYGGYIWRKTTDSFNTFNTNIKEKFRSVNKYTKDNIFINTYDTVTNAVKSVNKDSTSSISRCCNGKLNSAYGYKWFYADDPNQPDKTKIIDTKEVA